MSEDQTSSSQNRRSINVLKQGDTVKVFESPPELMFDPVPREIKLSATSMRSPESTPNRRSKKGVPSNTPYLILGFDTEFKTPDYLVDRDEVSEGKAKYKVLSYQFHAKTSSGREWQGICCPREDERMTLGEFIVFALGLGAQDSGLTDLPTDIYLVGHFTRADVPAFADFQELIPVLSNVRNTFINIGAATKLVIEDSEKRTVSTLNIFLRDTLLLTPQSSRSLKGIGELVGHPKLVLDQDPNIHRQMIRNMDKVRSDHWSIFRAYALNDATICVKYIESVIQQYQEVTGATKIPVTLTSIGIELLMNTWRDKLNLDPLQVVGKESVKKRYFDKRLGYFKEKTTTVDIEQISWHLDFVTESYHGGRNEQFWFGPGFEDNWTDFDLSSAYPTAMSLIGMPQWTGIHEELDPYKFTATTLGFANVDFEFPQNTRFPTMPVRTDHGLVFPLKGTSYCSSPELVVALKLGAKIKINRGVIVPTDGSVRVFGEFIKECLKRRKEAGSKTLKGLFWKEISNSTYGKTAQGLRSKRVFDMRDQLTKELPPSPITNPFFASYITSFTRAILGEIINNLAPDTCVFSCTTDGFLTNASDAEVAIAQQGSLCKLFAETRENLTGGAAVLEKKHEIRLPLGWRTRGQATLVPGIIPGKDDSYTVVLAKGGIFTPPELDSITDQNDEIVMMFYARTPEKMIRVESMTGVRDMVNHNADLVGKVFSKRLNMEFDWKRKPRGADMSSTSSGSFPSHLMFSTQPWQTIDNFDEVREAWDDYIKDGLMCLKDIHQFQAFAQHVEVRSCMTIEQSKYMGKRVNSDLKRLRQMLCSAWHHGEAGLSKSDSEYTAREFSELLSSLGIPCKKTDVENGRNKPFRPNYCPPTDQVLERLKALQSVFPGIDVDLFVVTNRSDQAVTLNWLDG
ncbi:DNA polymerase [Roseateles sp. PN1]|uniref:DNA polymerase n=1 Tax=Roseateles sp. PN1 TaxID=3137372 RepID=UPI0031390691